jgi:hypothetical protein
MKPHTPGCSLLLPFCNNRDSSKLPFYASLTGDPQKDNFHKLILSVDKMFPFGYLRRHT